MNDGRLLKRLTDSDSHQSSIDVVSHVDVTRDARYVVAVMSCHCHETTTDHVIIYDVNTGQVLCDGTTQSTVIQLATSADSDKVQAYASLWCVVPQYYTSK